MTTDFITTAYLIYLPVSLLLIIFSAKMLFKNGLVFMMDIFHGNKDLAISTNKLFEIGYFLLNVGFALMILEMYGVESYQQMIEKLSTKIGGFTIYLGVIFMLNVVLFINGRKKALQSKYHISNEL